jgi:hypothetical protein
LTMNDSPFMELRRNVKKVNIVEIYRTYVMYKTSIPPSRWAPLGYVEWKWMVDHDKGRATSKWPTTFKFPPIYTKTAELTFKSSDALPDWHGATYTLVRDINDAVGYSALEYEGTDWNQPVTTARQMLIKFDKAKSASFQAEIEGAIGTRISNLDFGKNYYLAWTSREMADRAMKVAGVTGVEELGAFARYLPKPPNKEYLIYLAPFFLFHESENDRQFAQLSAPLQPDELATELIRICETKGIRGVVTELRGFDKIKLTFPKEPGDLLLTALAAHPQVNYIQPGDIM